MLAGHVALLRTVSVLRGDHYRSVHSSAKWFLRTHPGQHTLLPLGNTQELFCLVVDISGVEAMLLHDLYSTHSSCFLKRWLDTACHILRLTPVQQRGRRLHNQCNHLTHPVHSVHWLLFGIFSAGAVFVRNVSARWRARRHTVHYTTSFADRVICIQLLAKADEAQILLFVPPFSAPHLHIMQCKYSCMLFMQHILELHC